MHFYPFILIQPSRLPQVKFVSVFTPLVQVAEFKEFEWRPKFKPPLKYVRFYLKLYQMFQDLSRRSIEIGFWRI